MKVGREAELIVMKKLAYIFSIALFISGCLFISSCSVMGDLAKNLAHIPGQINHWRLQAYMQTDEAKRYCSKKGKITHLVFEDGWTYKCKSVDK